MFNRKGIVGIIAGTWLGMSGLAVAEEPTLVDTEIARGSPTVTEEKIAESSLMRRPLMSLLEEAGLTDPLDALRINIFGHAEGSYTYNFRKPGGDIFQNTFRVFDVEHDELTLNQINLTIERTVDLSQNQWDAGFRVEWIYGGDAGFIHSNGLFDYYDDPRDPENQFDLNQAYIDVAVPVGNGLLLRGGKFVTLLGQETINPTGNALYSHSFLFGFAIPFTHTGILGTYSLNDQWSFTTGVTRGWEQSLEDNNDAIDFTGQVKYTPNEKVTALVNFITGPEAADNETDYRSVIDVVVSWTAADNLTLAINADYGHEQDAAAGGDAQWYGIAGYAGLRLDDRFTINGRVEWFRDDDGTRLGVITNLYEATLGLAITPFPNDAVGSNLKLRPELRVDVSEDDVFDGGTEDYQVTAAIDVIFTY